MTKFEIRGLRADVLIGEEERQEILTGVDLTINSGETHAIMGPNGSGKSTLAYAIAGHPRYEVTEGEVLLDGENILDMEVDERARAGVFLAMQYPVEVPGVSMSNFLRSAMTAVRGEAPKLRQFSKELQGAMKGLGIESAFAAGGVKEGFSGGERRRRELLRVGLREPETAGL